VSGRWFFHTDESGIIQLMARFEDAGVQGDAHDTCSPGQSLGNLSYDELKQAGAGSIVQRRGKWVIESQGPATTMQ
jgi:hypothetical protein